MRFPLSFMGVSGSTDTDNPAILIVFSKQVFKKAYFTGMQAVYFSSRDIINP